MEEIDRDEPLLAHLARSECKSKHEDIAVKALGWVH